MGSRKLVERWGYPLRVARDPDARGLLVDDPDANGPTLVLAHGAGAPMDSAWMETVARGLAGAGMRVVRFEFPYMRERRAGGKRRAPDREPVLRAAWAEAVEALGGGAGLVIGGKSLGGRMAAYVADELGVRACVCLGYPFHPPGRPEKTRTAVLETIETPTLILQGSRDPFGTPAEVAGYRLSPSVRVRWIEDGDHSFKPRKRSGRTEARNLTEACQIVAEFLGS